MQVFTGDGTVCSFGVFCVLNTLLFPCKTETDDSFSLIVQL